MTPLLSLLTAKLACFTLTLQAQGKLDEAEPLYQRCPAIYEKALGPDHPHVATSLNNLAACCARHHLQNGVQAHSARW